MNDFASPLPSNPAPVAPKTFGQILDRIYRLMRSHLRLFLGIAAVPSATIILIMTVILGIMFIAIGPQLAANSSAPLVMPKGFWLFVPLLELILPLIYVFYFPAAIYAATQADLGVTVTFSQAYGVAWRHFGRYLWLIILCSLFVIVPLAVIAALAGIGALLLHNVIGSNGMFFLVPLLVLLYLAFLVYCVLIMIRFAMAFPACVAEDISAWDSLKRSATLTRGAMGRIFLVLLLVYAINYVVTMVCMLVFFVLGALGVLAAIFAHVSEGSHAYYILIGLAIFGYLLVFAVSMLITYSANTTALAVLYRDQRLRKDGQIPAQAGNPS